MKILLVQPTVEIDGGIPLKKEKCDVGPCLALPTVAANAPEDVETEIIEECYKDLNFDADCDLVGLTSMTHCIKRAYDIAGEFRQRGRKVVMGGWHASLFPDKVLQHCDAVVVGEAEKVWPLLIEDFRRGEMKKTYRCDSPSDLASLPVPRMDLLKGSAYGSCFWPVQTSRGCPNRCQYCCINELFKGGYRIYPTESVIRAIENCPTNNIHFIDDNLVVNVRRTEELFNAIIPLGIRWTSQADIRIARRPEMLELLKKSGCTSLNIGLESINQEALDGCGKGFNKVKEFSECLKIIRESGITPTVNFMFGFEQDRKDVFAETLEFIDNNPVGWAHFMVLTPVPGSLLWDKLLTENRIFDQNWSHYDGMHVVFEPKNMTAEELERNYWNTHNEYLSYRRSLRRSISNGIRNFKDSWRFNMAARSKFKRNREALYF